MKNCIYRFKEVILSRPDKAVIIEKFHLIAYVTIISGFHYLIV